MTAWATSPVSVWTGFILAIAYLIVGLIDLKKYGGGIRNEK